MCHLEGSVGSTAPVKERGVLNDPRGLWGDGFDRFPLSIIFDVISYVAPLFFCVGHATRIAHLLCQFDWSQFLSPQNENAFLLVIPFLTNGDSFFDESESNTIQSNFKKLNLTQVFFLRALTAMRAQQYSVVILGFIVFVFFIPSRVLLLYAGMYDGVYHTPLGVFSR